MNRGIMIFMMCGMSFSGGMFFAIHLYPVTVLMLAFAVAAYLILRNTDKAIQSIQRRTGMTEKEIWDEVRRRDGLESK